MYSNSSGVVNVINNLQGLNEEDKAHIFTTINALLCDAKARTTYSLNN